MYHKIVPMRMDTTEAAKCLDVKADFIYVDASHDEESVYNDIMNWYPKLKEGGTMCGDDANWSTVLAAVKRAAQQFGVSLQVDGPFWYFEPKPTSRVGINDSSLQLRSIEVQCPDSVENISLGALMSLLLSKN